MAVPAVPLWQLLVPTALLAWVLCWRRMGLTVMLRRTLQPRVVKRVEMGIPFLVRLQRMQDPRLDFFLSGLSTLVSVEFYTAFLPLLFWSENGRLARQMTLLMAACTYVGNCIKDMLSSPRPPCPPVRRYVISHAEKDAALEYGLPSSHTINTICLAAYLLHNLGGAGSPWFWSFSAILFPAVAMVIYSRLYLGMHAPIDIMAGVMVGGMLLFTWICIDEALDEFITGGQNVLMFWIIIAVLLSFAYPTPELATPSYQFHTAFNGVALGIVCGIHRTRSIYGISDALPVPLQTWAGFMILTRRTLIGLPVILTVKMVTKALVIRLLPSLCRLVGLPIHSSSYIPFLQPPLDVTQVQVDNTVTAAAAGVSGGKYRPLSASQIESLDVDTGVRLLQYAGLSWSVAELVPFLFRRFGL